MRLVDSHCHLTDPRFNADREAVLLRAREAGVVRMVTVGTGPDGWEAALALTASEPDVSCALGLHPHEAAAGLEGLEPLLPKAVALGEIGLDYHYDFAPRDKQRAAFAEQVALARRLRLPIIIHEREAAEDVLAVLREHAPLDGVWHCFSGGPALAEQVLALGLHLGFGGLITFKKGTEAIQEAARLCPLERLLLETDAPYLAPVPHRGKRNEPAFIASTAMKLAELRGVEAEALAAATAENALRLFSR